MALQKPLPHVRSAQKSPRQSRSQCRAVPHPDPIKCAESAPDNASGISSVSVSNAGMDFFCQSVFIDKKRGMGERAGKMQNMHQPKYDACAAGGLCCLTTTPVCAFSTY